MRTTHVAVIACLFALPACPAAATTWYIGPNLGFDVLHAQGTTSTVFAVPSGADLFFSGLRPGLRFGGFDANGLDEGFLDVGILAVGGDGQTYHSMLGTINYAHLLATERNAPYLTVGGGGGSVGVSGNSQTFLTVGGGLGVRNRLSHGHGAVRFELRYDRLSSTERGSQAVSIFGLKIGFDLDLN